LAIALAQRLPCIILSADSRQVYRDFDIGTAKPSGLERSLVPHHLIDLCEPTETLTVAAYQQQAQALIHAIHAAGTAVPLLVGGTGLYIKSVVRGMVIPQVPPQPTLRAQLATLDQPWRYQLLCQVDAAAGDRIHPNDQVRTLRALEVFYISGIPMSQQQGEHPPTYPILQIGLDCLEPDRIEPNGELDVGWDSSGLGSQDRDGKPELDPLTQRIQIRTEQMIALGFVDEVRQLCQRYGDDLPLLNTLGYREMRDHLQGRCSLAEAIAQTVLHTRQFAKRQRTWFRADPAIRWFNASDPGVVDQVWAVVQVFLQQQISLGR
jgi:tRNA dimethylallyltransferase